MSRVPKSITIPTVVLFLLGSFTMVVGAVMITQVVMAGITIMLGGLSGIIMGLGLRMGRLRVLSSVYITSMLAIFFAMLIYAGAGLSNLLVMGLPALVIYAFVMKMLFSRVSTEYCSVVGGDPPTLREILCTLSPRKRQTSPAPMAVGGPTQGTAVTDAAAAVPPQEGVPTMPVAEPEAESEPFVSWRDVLGYDRETVPEAPEPEAGAEIQEPVAAAAPAKTEASVEEPVATHSEPTDGPETATGEERAVNQPEVFRYCIGCGFDLHRLPRTARHCPRCGIEIMWGDEQ